MFKTLIPARHPYYPTDIALDGFSPATLDMTTILSAFGLGAVVVVAAIWLLSGGAAKSRFQFSVLVVQGHIDSSLPQRES